MTNGKLQTDIEPSNKPRRKGRIQMGLQRTLSTEKYQSIVIHYDIDEEIDWQTLSEREKKVMNWETVMSREFKQIHDRVLDELNLSHKKAYFVDHTEKDDRPEPGKGLDDLDNLDTL